MVRKKDIIHKLKQYVLQQDIAARIIQYYWKQYLKYIGWYDKHINKDLHHEWKHANNKKGLEPSHQIDYNYRPVISNKSRKLAEKRRKDMGMKGMKVEEVLIKESKIKNALKEQLHFENIIRENKHNKMRRKATRAQANRFYQKQKVYKENAQMKAKQQRVQNHDSDDNDLTYKPKINNSSRSLKRSYNDLINWKLAVESKNDIKRKQKEKDEDVSLKSYKSSKANSRSFVSYSKISKGN